MFSLVALSIIAVYCLIFFCVVIYAMVLAGRKKIPKWKYAVPAALVMYLPIFWDHIPTKIAYDYYCNRDAGFKVYKTVDEWVIENPGVVEIQEYKDVGNSVEYSEDGKSTFLHSSNRFDTLYIQSNKILNIRLAKRMWVDRTDSSVLAEVTNFQSGDVFGGGKPSGLKFWLYKQGCSNVTGADYVKFKEYKQSFKDLSEVTK